MVFERRVPIKSTQKQTRFKQGTSYRKQREREQFVNNLIWNAVKVGIFVALIFLVILSIYIAYVFTTLPDVSVISNAIPNETTKIYSADGYVLADLHKEENRMVIPSSKISQTMKNAVIAIEDVRFYQHHGVDPIGILRASLVDIVRHDKAQGASTLTQQLARNVFLTKKKHFQRKIQEILIALKIERQYTKDEILEMYLNEVYWGHNAYGIEAASLQYFNKHAEDLTIAESALLAGMLTAPEYYSPWRNPDKSLKRKDIVLNRIYKAHYITRSEYLQAKAQVIKITERQKTRYSAPYFTSAIIDKLVSLYGEEAAYSSGLKVYTSLNYKMQSAAEKAVEDAMAMGRAASMNFSQAALVAVDTSTGYVTAMVGGYDYLHNHYNKVLQAKRQPGSSFKPFVYLTALSRQISPGTIFSDSPTVYNTFLGPYAPSNYEHDYMGRIPMSLALAKSKNVVAVKLISMLRPEAVIDTARTFGITAKLMPVLSLALGTQEVSMLEMVEAYGAFANGGTLYRPVMITRIEDRNGVVLYRENVQGKKVYDSNIIAVLVDMMKGVIDHGTGVPAKLERPMAGKTGTTSDYKDAWFIGFVPQMAVATWVGNDDGRPMNKVTGGLGPAVMWKEFMKDVLVDVPPIDFQQPAGLVSAKICWDSGKLAGPYCPHTSVEKFWPGHEPHDTCNWHGPGSVAPPEAKEDEGAAPPPANGNTNGTNGSKPNGWVKDFLE